MVAKDMSMDSRSHFKYHGEVLERHVMKEGMNAKS